jgi:hypothetical protein
MELVLYKLFTFHVLNLKSIFHCLGHLPKEFTQVWGSCTVFITYFCLVKDCYPHAQPPSWSATPCHLSSCSYPPYLEAIPSAPTSGRTMLWLWGIHLTWVVSSYNILSSILPQSLSLKVEKIIWDHQCEFRCNRWTTGQIFCFCQILKKIMGIQLDT